MSTPFNALGHAARDGDVFTLTLQMAGRVNTVQPAFIEGLEAFLDWLDGQHDVRGLIITSGHRDFCVGADIDMLYAARDPSALLALTAAMHRATRRLETLGIPVVAALNGSALGGGYELALACHHRVALDSPRLLVGLPEVSLGVMPGGGGTQRLPRLIGLQAACEHMAKGQPLRANKALKTGLVDHIAHDHDDLRAKAMAFIADHPKARQPWDSSRFRWPGGVRPDSPDGRNLFAVAAALLYKKTAGAYTAPQAMLQAVQEGSILTLDRALDVEARAFAHLATGDQAKDMIRTLWTHRNAANKHEGLPAAEQHGVQRVGILGAGMMGAGLAFICAKAGLNVVLRDLSPASVERGLAHCQAQAKRLRYLDPAARAKLLGRIQGTTDLEPLRGVDLVIEAVFEDLELKHRVTREVEPLLAEGGIYATNTSAIPITELAQASARPRAFIGLHFFSPVEKMPLVEIVRGAHTDDETVARCLALARAIKKTPIVVNDGYGFYTSRVFAAYIVEGAQLLAEGYHPDLIEWVAREQGMVVPPLQVFDEVSLELGVKAMAQAERLMGSSPLPGKALVQALVEEHGRKGKSDGGGFYRYEGAKRRGIWPGLAALVPQREIAPTDRGTIGRRLMLAQVAEVSRALHEGIIDRPRDAELGAVLGLGFAPQSGGPLAWMDRQGIAELVAQLHRATHDWGARFTPSPTLVRMAQAGERFYPA